MSYTSAYKYKQKEKLQTYTTLVGSKVSVINTGQTLNCCKFFTCFSFPSHIASSFDTCDHNIVLLFLIIQRPGYHQVTMLMWTNDGKWEQWIWGRTWSECTFNTIAALVNNCQILNDGVLNYILWYVNTGKLNNKSAKHMRLCYEYKEFSMRKCA